MPSSSNACWRRRRKTSPGPIANDKAAYRSAFSFRLTAPLSGEGRSRSLVVCQGLFSPANLKFSMNLRPGPVLWSLWAKLAFRSLRYFSRWVEMATRLARTG